MAVFVLRLGHRIGRDKRISTHCGLVSRALGAEAVFYSGEKDESMERSIRKVVDEWGGPFGISHVSNWRRFVQGFRGRKTHLTMYGMPVQKAIGRIRTVGDLLVIVGGEKVPGEVYRMADFNVAVSSQPHSEVAALALFLHEYLRGRELEKDFHNARRRIVPQERGKKTVSLRK
jgi:tRNA (cytidine56-2'-O)-methyltransferase